MASACTTVTRVETQNTKRKANPRDCDVEDTGDVRLFTTKTHCKYVFINTESTDAAAANLAEARRGFFYEERIPF
ncbi:Hypothetical protein SMAX5B_020822 [Scophthalmus maximus]|uniref:Uncharacterized protein n=1 Tax=Scophthalmus maximus TaxID=52904 RepID=A0A2U9CRF5_SCOMX|nr:Hypothetical protein SMAX5B_020822 [Scophthalmus maximus]